MQRTGQRKRHFLRWVGMAAFVTAYPMLLSIYVDLPLFIGVWGYVLLLGMVHNRFSYIVIAFVYFVDLDLNVSLPFWLPIVAVISVYWLVVPLLQVLRRCAKCMALIAVLAIDASFYGMTQLYDFIFQTHTLRIDTLALVSLVTDMVTAVFLL